jgi:hypothetical protein
MKKEKFENNSRHPCELKYKKKGTLEFIIEHIEIIIAFN